jgi:hypothetical protein
MSSTTSPVANPLFPGKHFIGTVLEALETKTTMSGELTRRYLQRAAMAGLVIGLLYAVNFAIIAAFDAVQLGETTLRTLGKMAGALAFGWALVFIHYSKSELLTSNMMVVSIGAYHRRIGWLQALRLLTLCFIGNFLGGLFMALLLRYSTLADGPVLAEMGHAVATQARLHHRRRCGLGRPLRPGDPVQLHDQPGDAARLQRAHQGGHHQEPGDGRVGLHLRLSRLRALRRQHRALHHRRPAGRRRRRGGGQRGDRPAGNFIGGGLLIGLYYAYVNDDAKYLRKRPQSAAVQSPEQHIDRKASS